jgi:hypothetical protein
VGEREEGNGPAGPCGGRQKEKEKPGWAGLQGEKERGKKKGESEPGPIRKEGEKELHSNAFEFEFEI